MYLKPDSSGKKYIVVIGRAVGNSARKDTLLIRRERAGQVLMWRMTGKMTK